MLLILTIVEKCIFFEIQELSVLWQTAALRLSRVWDPIPVGLWTAELQDLRTLSIVAAREEFLWLLPEWIGIWRILSIVNLALAWILGAIALLHEFARTFKHGVQASQSLGRDWLETVSVVLQSLVVFLYQSLVVRCFVIVAHSCDISGLWDSLSAAHGLFEE